MPYSEDDKFNISYMISSLYFDTDYVDKQFQAVMADTLDAPELKSLIQEMEEFVSQLEALTQSVTDDVALGIYRSSVRVGRDAVSALERHYLSMV